MAQNNQDITMIFKQLERMSNKIDNISKEVQLTNIEIAKLSGMKHALNDFKTWKENVESAVNPQDLRDMKSAIADIKKHKEEIESLEKSVSTLSTEKQNDKVEIDALKEFKTKAKTVVAVIVGLFSVAISIIGWFIGS